MNNFLVNLLDRAKAGDREAINELCSRYQPYIRTILRATGFLNDADMDDVLQECLLLISTRISTLKSNKAFISWLGSLAYRQAINHLRKQKKYVQLPESLHKPIQKEIDWDFLYSAIEELNAYDQQLIRGYYFEERTVEELAIVFGVPVKNLKRKIYSVKKQLKEILENNGD